MNNFTDPATLTKISNAFLAFIYVLREQGVVSFVALTLFSGPRGEIRPNPSSARGFGKRSRDRDA